MTEVKCPFFANDKICKFVLLVEKVRVVDKQQRKSNYIFLIFTSFVASDGLSKTLVTTLFGASIKVIYRLLSQGWKEMSIHNKKV